MSDPIIILGGRSLVAPFLLRLLQQAGLSGAVMSRRQLDLPAGFELLRLDLAAARYWVVPEQATVISLLPLWVLAQNLPRFMGAKTIIAVSSTSRFGKEGSDDPKEQRVAADLAEAETALEGWCERGGIGWSILRPTMIYDGQTDQNIVRIKQVIRRYGVFPVAAPAKGLRQPIHAGDVARAIMGALNNKAALGKALNIAGGEVLTYRQLVERVFQSLGRKPHVLMLPVPLLERAFRLGTRIGLLREKSFGFSVFKRMNEDLVFDVAEGLVVLGYEPRGVEI